MSIQNIKKLLHVQCIRMGNGDKIIVRRHTEFSVLHVYSGERRLRRSSENILFFSSDGRSLAGGGAESYRYPPAGGSSPELRVLTQRLSDNPTESDNQSSLSSLSSQKKGWSHMRPALSSIIRHALSQMRSDSQKSPPKLILRHGQKTAVLVISS
jgi:hypothetical protein